MCDFGLSRIDPAGHPIERAPESKIQQSKMASQLIEERLKREKAKRSVSPHVNARAYRAPEVILTERSYNYKIDMWSLGCCAAEMLYCANTSPIKTIDY